MLRQHGKGLSATVRTRLAGCSDRGEGLYEHSTGTSCHESPLTFAFGDSKCTPDDFDRFISLRVGGTPLVAGRGQKSLKDCTRASASSLAAPSNSDTFHQWLFQMRTLMS
jgi:hypothetical protein